MAFRQDRKKNKSLNIRAYVFFFFQIYVYFYSTSDFNVCLSDTLQMLWNKINIF